MVPKKGLEPPHPCEYVDLNHARLPIPPLRHKTQVQRSSAEPAAVPSLANAGPGVKFQIMKRARSSSAGLGTGTRLASYGAIGHIFVVAGDEIVFFLRFLRKQRGGALVAGNLKECLAPGRNRDRGDGPVGSASPLPRRPDGGQAHGPSR